MARIYPWISIPLGLLLMAPFVFGAVEEYFSSADRSVGAMFIPMVLFALFTLAAAGAFLFAWGIYLLKPGVRKTLLIVMLVSTTAIGGITYFWWSQANIHDVTGSAEKIAGDEPYCIDVPSENGIKEAGSLADFSGYLRQSPRGWGGYAGPRPILAIGDGVQPEVYHWSFYQKSFVKDDGRLTPIYCRPRRHFVLTMSNQQRIERRVEKIRYAGMYLAIPPSYRGEISYQSTPTITFFATAPLFGTVPDAAQPDAIDSFIEVNFADTNTADVWLNKGSQGYEVEDNGEQYGLRKQTSRYVGSGLRDRLGTPHFQYFDVSRDKRVTTLIDCPSESDGDCLHAFRSGGWTFTFHHRAVDLPKWRSMQAKLIQLTHSFVMPSVHGEDSPLRSD